MFKVKVILRGNQSKKIKQEPGRAVIVLSKALFPCNVVKVF